MQESAWNTKIINHPRWIPHRVVVVGSTEDTTGHYPSSEKSRPLIVLDKLHQRKLSINYATQNYKHEKMKLRYVIQQHPLQNGVINDVLITDLQVADYVGVGPTRCCAICTNYNPIIEVINRRLRNAINQQELKGQPLQWIFTG